MGTVEGLQRAYERFVKLPWDERLSGQQRIWFAMYEPAQERRLRLRIQEFEIATKNAGHSWKHIDITDTFAHWMANHEYREPYFEDPDAMDIELKEGFVTYLANQIIEALQADDVDEDTVVAVSGVASLFGLTRVSTVLEMVAPSIRGRLLVFFPGHRDGSNYRLLDARDGWNYHAIPIEATNGR